MELELEDLTDVCAVAPRYKALEQYKPVCRRLPITDASVRVEVMPLEGGRLYQGVWDRPLPNRADEWALAIIEALEAWLEDEAKTGHDT